MLLDLGPGIIPHQFAFVQTPASPVLHLWYYARKTLTIQRLEAAHWDTRDPIFFERCNGARPQGAVELSWLNGQILQGTPNPRLPRIPRSQVRYIAMRDLAIVAKNLATILEAQRPVFITAQIGAASGLGVTAYGPVVLPLQLALTDVSAQREHYTLTLTIHPATAMAQLAQANPNTPFSQLIHLFGNGGVGLRLVYTPLARQGAHTPRARTIDLLFPLDHLRVTLRALEKTLFAEGRLAALI